ncbi:MAG: glycosyltransferase family 4 protein [Paludibacteraceae bacterium]|nr:glycosyltransferase family 4 protein [Paludibacteraceae bacterium]
MPIYCTYIIIAALLLVLELVYFRIADRFNIVDRPNERSSHNSIVIRGGGIIFLLAAWIWSAFFGFNYPWFLAGLTIVCGISLWDDIHSLPDSVRLIAQFTAMFMMFADLGMINLENWWMIAPALIVCVGIINAYNFMDGINGITSGYSLTVLLPLIILNHSIHFIEMSYLIVAAIACVVFSYFNFRPKGKAKCFAGDVGSIGIAFIVLLPLGKLIIQTGDLTYILLLVVYGVDTILTICHRIMLHENLGQAHRKHAFQIMANELKIPHEVVSLGYMILQLIISLGLIYLSRMHWVYFLVAVIILCIVYLLFMKRYYHLHAQYLQSIEKK